VWTAENSPTRQNHPFCTYTYTTQVERVLRLDENVLRFFTLRPKTQADLIRARKGFKAGWWAEERTPEKALEAEREQKVRLFHEED
jgi:hypothetical protein